MNSLTIFKRVRVLGIKGWNWNIGPNEGQSLHIKISWGQYEKCFSFSSHYVNLKYPPKTLFPHLSFFLTVTVSLFPIRLIPSVLVFRCGGLGFDLFLSLYLHPNEEWLKVVAWYLLLMNKTQFWGMMFALLFVFLFFVFLVWESNIFSFRVALWWILLREVFLFFHFLNICMEEVLFWHSWTFLFKVKAKVVGWFLFWAVRAI